MGCGYVVVEKLLGSSKKQHASELRFPLVIEIVPGALSAMVHSHKLSLLQGEILCWSYVSKGLEAVKHPELVITLRREVDEPEDAFPDDPCSCSWRFIRSPGRANASSRARSRNSVVSGS